MMAARGLGELEFHGDRVSVLQVRRSGDGGWGRRHIMNAFVSLSGKYTDDGKFYVMCN